MGDSLKEIAIKILSAVFGIAVVVLLIYLGMKWQKNNDAKYPWIGSLFKIENEERSIRASERFKTLDDCRNWSQGRIQEALEGVWDYDCGTDCKYSEQTIINGQKVKTYSCSQIEK